MDYSKRLITSGVLAGLLLFVFVQNVYAYIDPGTGSYFLQLLIASLLGAAFTIKLYWKKVKAFFSDMIHRHNKDQKD